MRFLSDHVPLSASVPSLKQLNRRPYSLAHFFPYGNSFFAIQARSFCFCTRYSAFG
jgi:hypothetical protein